MSIQIVTDEQIIINQNKLFRFLSKTIIIRTWIIFPISNIFQYLILFVTTIYDPGHVSFGDSTILKKKIVFEPLERPGIITALVASREVKLLKQSNRLLFYQPLNHFFVVVVVGIINTNRQTALKLFH